MNIQKKHSYQDHNTEFPRYTFCLTTLPARFPTVLKELLRAALRAIFCSNDRAAFCSAVTAPAVSALSDFICSADNVWGYYGEREGVRGGGEVGDLIRKKKVSL